MGNLKDRCQNLGGTAVETSESVYCKLNKDAEPHPGGSSSTGYTSTDASQFSVLNAFGIVSVILGLVASGIFKAWALTAALGMGTGYVPETDVLIAVFVPIASFFFVDLPVWVFYSAALSWVGVMVGFILLLGVLTESNRGIYTLVSFGYGSLMVGNAVLSGISAAALSLVTVDGFGAEVFAEIYILVRMGILGIPVPILAGDGVFEFSQITWLGIVLFWIFGASMIAGGATRGVGESATERALE